MSKSNASPHGAKVHSDDAASYNARGAGLASRKTLANTILAFSRRVFLPFGLKAPRAGQPIFLSGRRRHGAPTFFIIGGSSPEHGRHPSSGIEWCAFGGIRPVS